MTTLASCARMSVPVSLPVEASAVLPADCEQVIYVTAEETIATAGELRMLSRSPDQRWWCGGEVIPVRLGRHGIAWGGGEVECQARPGFRLKKEGDGCAPAGVFRITQAFGSGPKPNWIQMPYIHCTSHHFGIDDLRSRQYNQIVDDRETTCDWSSPETMVPAGGCYDLGAVIAHNPQNVPGLGSCIFMHIWQGPAIPTSGCTAMSKGDLERVLRWLAPAKNPRLVLWVPKPD